MLKVSDKKNWHATCGVLCEVTGSDITSWWREVTCEDCIPAATHEDWLAEAQRRAALDGKR